MKDKGENEGGEGDMQKLTFLLGLLPLLQAMVELVTTPTPLRSKPVPEPLVLQSTVNGALGAHGVFVVLLVVLVHVLLRARSPLPLPTVELLVFLPTAQNPNRVTLNLVSFLKIAFGARGARGPRVVLLVDPVPPPVLAP